MRNSTAARSKNLNIRVLPEERDLFSRAATSQNKNLSEFVLDAARRKAQEVLLDVTRFDLDPERFQSFLRALEAPVKPNAALRKLLRGKPLWEK